MNPIQLWAKASLFVRSSTSTRTGPLWIGVDLTTGQALAARRWDTPAGYTDLLTVITDEQSACFAEDVRNARMHKKPGDHVCHAIPSLGLEGPAPTPKDGGQFGLVLDQEMVGTLDGIAAQDMGWITTPERKALHAAFSRLTREQIDAIAWAVQRAGFPITISAGANAVHFGGQRLDEIPA